MVAPSRFIHISLAEQRLRLIEQGRVVWQAAVSTGANGAGEANASGCTPRGWHRVRLAIGAGCPPGTVFVARRPTGERYSEALARAAPQRDWILTRILWLTGCEPGRNRGGAVDTLRRFIYIHGTPASEPMGVARSHGCIRLHDTELMTLFGQAPRGTPVYLTERRHADDPTGG